jgi:hypothetical protein
MGKVLVTLKIIWMLWKVIGCNGKSMDALDSHLLPWKVTGNYKCQWLLLKVICCFESKSHLESQWLQYWSLVAMESQWLP